MSEYAKANKLSLYVKNLEWAKLHPDKIIQYKLKYTQKSCSTLNSSYLRNLIYITSDICRAEITSEMIELKRISLINKRIIKNKTYETI